MRSKSSLKLTVRERVRNVFSFQPIDRLPIVEWAIWWDQTIQRWIQEGLPQGLDHCGLVKYFDQDLMLQLWIRAKHWRAPSPAYHGAGIIQNQDDYQQLKQKGFLYSLDTFDKSKWESWRQLQENGDAALWITWDGFFHFPRSLLGIERHLYAFYDQPELLHEICTDLLAYYRRILPLICEIAIPDFMTICEDMSYNHGPMLSEQLFNEFLLPYYQQLCPLLHEYGIKVLVDSDGNIMIPCSWFMRAGVDGLLPLERQAGVDVSQLRVLYPNVLLLGGFDKMVMNKGEEKIRAEFERLLSIARQGGFIISVDHQTPPSVSLEDYRLFLKIFREYAVLV